MRELNQTINNAGDSFPSPDTRLSDIGLEIRHPVYYSLLAAVHLNKRKLYNTKKNPTLKIVIMNEAIEHLTFRINCINRKQICYTHQ